MAKASENSDGLEIVSIGKLYSGTWEKKYWSSSRGKDRYPYPVGFKAVRTQNGITYRMEIFEGLKGPSFTISSTDGLSCSGQTPDIAWESFQKKGCSRPKLWRGKRFLCKIDGMEFFGFKSALVQRLLRELVASVGGAAEQNLLPSCICKKASETGDPIPQTDLSTYPDLLSYLGKPGATRKRSRNEKIFSSNSRNVAGHKEIQTQSMRNNAHVSSVGQSCQGDHSDMYSATINSLNQTEFDNKADASQRSEILRPVCKDDNLLVSAENDLHMKSLDVLDHPEADGTYVHDETKLPASRNYVALVENCNSHEDKETFNCSVTDDEDEERLRQSNMKTTNDSELCAPDTFDHPPDMTDSEVLMTESYPEGEMDADSSNRSSEKSDFDSVGREIANSMMTVLLPQALPLLKTFSRKKRNKLKPLEKFTQMDMDENKETVDVQSPVAVRGLKEASDLNPNKKEAHYSGTINPCLVPDSFDNGENENPFSKKLPVFPDIIVENQTPVEPDTCYLEAEAGPLGCNLAETDSKTELASSLGPPGCSNLISKVSIDFTFPSKRDAFANSAENALSVEEQCHEENAKTLRDSIEGILDPANSGQGKSETYIKKEQTQDKDFAEVDRSISNLQNRTVWCSSDAAQTAQKTDVENGSNLNDNVDCRQTNELEDVLKLIACYIHPRPILVALLTTVGNDIYLCLLCGSLAQQDKILFIYNAPITGEVAGCPSFVGHSSVILPSLKDSFGGNIALRSSILQFTPDAQSLVLVNSIKVPCCREGTIHCPCPSCTSDCSGDNAVKIVQVKVGYVSVMTKLKTAQTVQCILVCGPNHLLAADESGKLYLWVMNSRWSEHMEECYLSMPDHMPSSLVELKRIPKSAALVVGHNGYGEFGLWDVDKRILVSKFSAPSTSISKCVPISLFQWQRKSSIRTFSDPEKLIDEVLDATKMSFSGSTENKLALPIDSQDVAIWLLISTISGPDFDHGYESDDLQIDTVGCWRLALLVKDMVIIGNALDRRSAAIGASSGHGIIGRSDGLVYMWELSTGIKVGSLHHFKGTGVSCVATDSSNSGALAIASENGQLLVYMHSGAFCRSVNAISY